MKYKEFFKTVECIHPEICDLWKDFDNRPDPIEGDKYLYDGATIIFDKTMFDDSFKNGVAHIYYFHDTVNNVIKIRSINDVYKPELLTDEERSDYLGFWRYCTPYKS